MSTQRTLMHLENVGQVSCCFWQNVGITEVSKVTVIFPTADWREMGAPSEITLTLESGDQMNGEGSG